jgi:hypothetical protein
MDDKEPLLTESLSELDSSALLKSYDLRMHQTYILGYAALFATFSVFKILEDSLPAAAVLSLLCECPVAGYYIKVLESELNHGTDAVQSRLPTWSAKDTLDLFILGLKANAFQFVHLWVLVILPGIVPLVWMNAHPDTELLPLAAWLTSWAQQAGYEVTIGDIQQSAVLSGMAFSSILLLCFYLPAMLVNFARKGTDEAAYEWREILRLIRCQRHRLAVPVLMFFLIAAANSSTMLVPLLIAALLEPAIELVGMTRFYRAYARALRRCERTSCECLAGEKKDERK